MKRILIVAASIGLATSAYAQKMPTLTMESATPGGATDVTAKNLAEVAAANKIATIQVSGGKTLTKSMLQVAQGKTDISAMPFVLHFLLAKGLGPYSGVGRKKGKELAANLRLLYPYHLAHFYLIAFQSTGIDSYEKLKGKNVFNGPPRGGALNSARSIIRLVTGMKDGKGYKGVQVAWGQANSLFLDRSVDASMRPGTNPSAYMPLYIAAGKINIVSIPKAKYESKAFQKFMNAPGKAPTMFTLKQLAHYGPNVKIVSEDDKYRTVSDTGGDVVHKKMPKALAKALTAAFIKSVPDAIKKVPFIKGQGLGQIDDSKMRLCRAGVKLHPGAVEAWQEAGFKVADCQKP